MNTQSSNLKVMLQDMEQAPKNYVPTNFWSSGLSTIIDDIENLGFDKFRDHKSAKLWYVQQFRPNYKKIEPLISSLLACLKFMKNSKAKKLINILDGSDKAQVEYRLYRAAADSCINPSVSLNDIGENGGFGGELHEFGGKLFSRSMLSYLRAISYLNSLTKGQSISSALEIGGGYGTLGEIFLKSGENNFYVNVDIPPVASVSTFYLQEIFGRENVLSYEASRSLESLNLEELRLKYKAVVLCPWQLPKLSGEFDLFGNFISFQEMEPSVVANYAKVIQPLVKKYVLFRNSAHGKPVAKKSGKLGVIEPVTADFINKQFDEFSVLGKDSLVFGDESTDRQFRSEVTVLQRT